MNVCVFYSVQDRSHTSIARPRQRQRQRRCRLCNGIFRFFFKRNQNTNTLTPCKVDIEPVWNGRCYGPFWLESEIGWNFWSSFWFQWRIIWNWFIDKFMAWKTKYDSFTLENYLLIWIFYCFLALTSTITQFAVLECLQCHKDEFQFNLVYVSDNNISSNRFNKVLWLNFNDWLKWSQKNKNIGNPINHLSRTLKCSNL